MPAMTDRSARPVLSTYRLQLTSEFGFAAVRERVGYLARLGLSHLYLSPILEARPGSTHGYDVADPTKVSAALGGEDGLRELAAAAHAEGLGLVADIVPNHLGIGPENPDWQYLLAEGMSGEGGRVFDVDWHPPLPGADGKVILPVLGDHYGKILINGELRLVEEPDAAGRRFRIRYHDHAFPLSPDSLEALDRVGRIDTLMGTPGVAETWHRLHGLLERQHYRLVHWRIGDRVVNYRRFFAVSQLAGIRVEDDHVFDRTHDKIIQLVDEGVLDGLRVDHPDGLRDPGRYLERLAQRSGGVWTVVEKILHPGEPLEDWAAAGTTGYEFCNDVLGLFVDPAAEEVFTQIDHDLGGDKRSYDEQVSAAKHEILRNDLSAEATRLAARLWALAQEHLEVRDLDDRHCLTAVSEVLVAMHVYRAYVDPVTGAASQRDRALVEQAVWRARDTGRADDEVLDFLGQVLRGDAGHDLLHLDFIARFQQLSGALMAKGVEDTVFYRYLRMVALNEVGGDPARFGLTAQEFHRLNRERSERHPAGMITTATHDTKRGEDVRLRIAALSEMPQRWADLVTAMSAGTQLDGPTVSLLAQTMVGVWPVVDAGGPGPQLRERLQAYARKASREAGLHTNWYDPADQYEQKLGEFIDAVLGDDSLRKPLAEVAGACAQIGMVSSLAQVLLRTLSPGVPDTYQGNELWDDSLVDPDNRRPVDWQRRVAVIGGLADADAAVLWDSRGDGVVKARVLTTALHARRAHSDAVGAESGYEPVEARGQWAEHVVAFTRTAADRPRLVVVAPRLPGAVMGPEQHDPIGQRWEDTTVSLPAGQWRNLFDDNGQGISGDVGLATLLAALPVALLVSDA